MVLLTVTPAAKIAIDAYYGLRKAEASDISHKPGEPSLTQVSVGDPVSHGQLIDIARFLQEQHGHPSDERNPAKHNHGVHLDALLKGSKTYTAPPKPKPEPSPHYIALMARLRAEEEERAYERMINPPLPVETFEQRFPHATYTAGSEFPVKDGEDEVVYADVNRQLALIVNVLVSIICCSVAIWIAARHWNTPARLALSMIGSGLVAAAEIVIFTGYITRVRDAKQSEAARVETKEVMETWIIDGKKDKKALELADRDALRNRKGRHR